MKVGFYFFSILITKSLKRVWKKKKKQYRSALKTTERCHWFIDIFEDKKNIQDIHHHIKINIFKNNFEWWFTENYLDLR